jgi:endoglucanase
VPGSIEAENFDLGCQGVTYNDTTSGNNGGAFRTSDVDIATTVDNGQSDFNVGWVAQGEWLEYSVRVQQAGNYNLSYRVATPQTSGQIQLFAKGTLLSTTSIAATGGWETWATVNAGTVALTAGEQILRIYFSGPEVNLNAFSLTPAQASSSKSSVVSSKSSSPSSVTVLSSKSSMAPSTSSAPSSKSSVASSKSSASSIVSSSSANDPLISGATYVLVAKHSGKALDVRDNSTSNGAGIQQWSYGGGANQQWVITKISASHYKIISKHSGKALDVKDLSLNNGAGIQQWDYQGGNNQLWTITALGGGDYSIISAHSGKALDVSNASNDNGANVHQWTYQGATNQRWLLTTP